jgi:hypothetical protein
VGLQIVFLHLSTHNEQQNCPHCNFSLSTVKGLMPCDQQRGQIM